MDIHERSGLLRIIRAADHVVAAAQDLVDHVGNESWMTTCDRIEALKKVLKAHTQAMAKQKTKA